MTFPFPKRKLPPPVSHLLRPSAVHQIWSPAGEACGRCMLEMMDELLDVSRLYFEMMVWKLEEDFVGFIRRINDFNRRKSFSLRSIRCSSNLFFIKKMFQATRIMYIATPDMKNPPNYSYQRLDGYRLMRNNTIDILKGGKFSQEMLILTRYN